MFWFAWKVFKLEKVLIKEKEIRIITVRAAA